ncbi:SIMPL domain-containing protein [soil metagenome]
MRNIFFALGTILVLVVTVSILPVDKINWGRISILPAATITVTGSAEGTQTNQMATFNATVSSTNSDKATAVNKTNTSMTALIASLKNFGIADADIKTESVNVYQMPVAVPQTQTMMYPVPPQGTSNGDWQATNSITITLRDVSKASDLTDLLNKSGASNVYGPNLTVDPNSNNDSALLSKAVADAKAKAESIAKAGGQTLGKMINVQESGSSYPMPMYAVTGMMKDSATLSAPVQPGTTNLSKSVTVVFELK